MRQIKVTLTLLVLIPLVFISCSSIPSTTEIDKDIESISSEIKQAREESNKYESGLVKVFIEIRIQVLENTKAMLLQKRTGLSRFINIKYLVDGKSFDKPANSQELIKQIDEDISQYQTKLMEAEKENEQYEGGLVKSFALLRIETTKATLAMLESQKLSLKYGFPIYTQLKEASHKTQELSGKGEEKLAGKNKATIESGGKTEKIEKVEVPYDPTRMENEGYREAKWGMTSEEVEKALGQRLIHESGRSYYATEIDGTPADIVFYFVDNLLYRVIIGFKIETQNKNTYISKFKSLEELLGEKYGKPIENIKKGSNNPYIDDGMAIATGQGIYRTRWDAKESEITLVMIGDNYEIHLGIVYESKKYAKKAEEEQKEKTLEKF